MALVKKSLRAGDFKKPVKKSISRPVLRLDECMSDR